MPSPSVFSAMPMPVRKPRKFNHLREGRPPSQTSCPPFAGQSVGVGTASTHKPLISQSRPHGTFVAVRSPGGPCAVTFRHGRQQGQQMTMLGKWRAAAPCTAKMGLREAQTILRSQAEPAGTERVLLGNAGFRILAEPLFARIDSPRETVAARPVGGRFHRPVLIIVQGCLALCPKCLAATRRRRTAPARPPPSRPATGASRWHSPARRPC